MWALYDRLIAEIPEDLVVEEYVPGGHFRNVERKLDGISDLYILERRPSDGDYPDSACEYILPGVEYIYATGM